MITHEQKTNEILRRIEAIPLKTFDEIVNSVLSHAAANVPTSTGMASWYRGQLWGAYLMTNGNTEYFDKYQAADRAITAMASA